MRLMENNDETGFVSSEPLAARSGSQSHQQQHQLHQHHWQRRSPP